MMMFDIHSHKSIPTWNLKKNTSWNQNGNLDNDQLPVKLKSNMEALCLGLDGSSFQLFISTSDSWYLSE